MASIRKMRIEDVDVIYELECLLFGQSAWPKETLIQDMESFEFDVLIDQNQIIGYCSLMVSDQFADVLNIGVHPNYRQQGYGTMLMKHMIATADRNEVDNITLEVRVSNKNAISLYESLGFVSVAKRKQYYQDGEDALLMILERK